MLAAALNLQLSYVVIVYVVSYSSRWSGIVLEYYPEFTDGWKYPGHAVNLEDIGLSLPQSDHTQQVVISQSVECVSHFNDCGSYNVTCGLMYTLTRECQ